MPSKYSYEILEGFKQPPQKLLKYILIGVGALMALIVVFSSFYTVAAEERAVVLRFGSHIDTTGPGLHFKLPLGIDSAIKVPVTKIRVVDFTVEPEPQPAPRRGRPGSVIDEEIKLMLTGDLNIASVAFAVHYRIKDAKDWIFNVRNQDQAIRDIGESVLRAVVGDHTVTEVLTEKRIAIALAVREQLQRRLDDYKLGVTIEAVQLKEVTPPGPVQASFNEVNTAQQEKSKLVNEADSQYNSVIPKARGEALMVKSAAEGEAIRRVNEARGDVAQFNAIRKAYVQSGELTRRRLYLETLEKVFPKVERIVVAREGNILKMLPLLGEGGGR